MHGSLHRVDAGLQIGFAIEHHLALSRPLHLRQVATNLVREAVTDGEGRFRFPYLRVGRYEIVRKPSNYGWPTCYKRDLGYYKWNFHEFAPNTTTAGTPSRRCSSTRRPSGSTFYDWDALNRLSQVEPPSGPVTLSYDGNGAGERAVIAMVLEESAIPLEAVTVESTRQRVRFELCVRRCGAARGRHRRRKHLRLLEGGGRGGPR